MGSATVLMVGLLGASSAPPAAADPVVCDQGVNVFVWDGGAHTANWNDAQNWNVDCTPGLLGQPYDDHVTIPAGQTVVLNGGESANVASLHNMGHLVVAAGAWLTTLDDSVSHTLDLAGGLASHGDFEVTSLLRWTHGGAGAPTQTTRRCPPLEPGLGYEPNDDPWEEDCSSPATNPGRTVIDAGAMMLVDGVGVDGRGGVNLSDGRHIENNGTVILSNNGYIAADDGTRFHNARTENATGEFIINNDFGYFQGFTADDLNWPVGESAFQNAGAVTKADGDGVSIIAADFSNADPDGASFTGQVLVRAGTLSIATPIAKTERTANVEGGARFGNGGCEAASGCTASSPDPTAADRKVVTVQVTRTTGEPTLVNITEEAPGLNKPVDITVPNADEDGAYSYRRPLRYRIYLQLDPGGRPGTVAKNAPVFRNGVKLPNCNRSSQDPTKAKPTCVARRLSERETAASDFAALPGKDVVLVISSVQNSRYRVGG